MAKVQAKVAHRIPLVGGVTDCRGFYREQKDQNFICRMLTPNNLTPGSSDVLVLGFSLEAANATELRLFLDEAERLRADRFVNEVHRQRFIAARAALRLALAHVMGRPPQSLNFRYGAYGKPALAGSKADLRFNLSHAESRALIVLARGREVGIDIEQVRLVEPLELARFCFSPRERIALQKLSAPERVQAFFRGWTRKESFIKANGRGLSYPLDSFDVSLDESPEKVLLADSSEPDGSERQWTTVSLEAGRHFAAAVTAEGTNWRLVRCETSISELQELSPSQPSTS